MTPLDHLAMNASIDLPRPFSRTKALLALLLIAPAPTLGVIAALVGQQSPLGTAIWAGAKVWLLLFPLLWLLVVDRRPLSFSPIQRGGMLAGTISGLAICLTIMLGAWIALPWIDVTVLREKMNEVGLGNPWVFLGATLYWIFINSVLEEYVYRWFIFEKSEQLLTHAPRASSRLDGVGISAIILSAAIFTVHHALIVSVYFSPIIALLASIGVFAGGAIWSALYLKYRSIWPAWISHAWADVGVFAVGGYLIFSS